jgi:arabinofuranosyltransferase
VKPFLILWGVLLPASLSADGRRLWAQLPARRRQLVIAGGVIAALFWGWHLASCFDDAFISFRYARNLARGEGLVWNPGERVEGYTNFLWTVLIGGAFWIGASGPAIAILGGLASFAGVLLLLGRISRRLSSTGEASPFALAAVLLGANYIFASYATSGLETMWTALLATLALERAMDGRAGQAGLAGIAAVMAHPDLSILYAGLGAALLLDRQLRRQWWRYGIPFVALYVPYFLWRWHYYGDFFPNTYYAKSGNLTYFRQGILFLAASALQTGVFLLAPLAAFACWRHRDELISRYALVSLPLYFFYLGKIGGDFMLGRLFVPVMPVLALLAERAVKDLREEGRRMLAGGLVASLAIVAAPVRLFEPRELVFGMADERTFYGMISLSPFRAEGLHTRNAELIRDGLAGTGLKPLLAMGNIGIVGYLTELPIIDTIGLTDRTVAHQPLQVRGRPGHEKHATAEYLRSRGVVLTDNPLYDPKDAPLTTFRLHGVSMYLGRYDPTLLHALRGRPDVEYLPFDRYLDQYLSKGVQGLSPAQVESDSRFFEQYYFSCNDDPIRRARLQALRLPAAGAVPTAAP